MELMPSDQTQKTFDAARSLLRQMAAEGFSIDADSRLPQIQSELNATGTYRQMFEELQFSSRVAWRNSTRCIGRQLWRTLTVVDARDLTTAEELFSASVDHLRKSTNGGRIRPMITVFAPADARGIGPRILNDQLIRYAGYRRPDGPVIGDPEQVEFTKHARQLGWQPPADPGPFDLLPLVIQMPGSAPRWFELPQDAVLEVPIRHPQFDWFENLKLKWHALPAVSRMALVAGGITYPASPFSGFYMGTEIASRNFGDAARYNLLPVIADRLGLDRLSSWSLWRDRVLVELNAAVLYSFNQAGVTIIDHHRASEQFMNHIETEQNAGRDTPGDWSWLVPPMSASACPVFHRAFDLVELTPNYVHQANATGS